MIKKSIFMVLPLTLVALTACETNHRHKESRAPGTYHSTSKTTNSHGTNYERHQKEVVKVDQYGRKYTTVETNVEKDPRGLFNKSETTSRQVLR